MKITALDIIKFLPLEENFKSNLLTSFDKLNPDQKFAMEQLVWDAYEGLYKLKLEENIKLALLDAKDSSVKMDENFYVNMKIKTEKQMETEFSKDNTDTDILQIRAKLEAIMKSSK